MLVEEGDHAENDKIALFKRHHWEIYVDVKDQEVTPGDESTEVEDNVV